MSIRGDARRALFSAVWALMPLALLTGCDADGLDIDYAQIGDLIEENGGDCDRDDDGFRAALCGGDDCDDADGTVHPGAAELCDGIDRDCSGAVDDVGGTCEVGVGACRAEGQPFCMADGTLSCDAVEGAPAAEVCDGLDNDCDGEGDEEVAFCRGFEEVYLKAPDPGADDRFGEDVAVSGRTLVVGASWERGDAQSTVDAPNDAAEGAGAVYVYAQAADGAWVHEAYLKASNAGAFDYFGSAVAIAGDTLVVGAYSEAGDAQSTVDAPNEAADEAGAVYVYERQPDGAWAQSAYLKAPNAQAGDLFGLSVSIAGDTLAVGASAEDGDAQSTLAEPNDGDERAGAVYVFERQPDGGWAPSAYLKAPNAQAVDGFGISVALAGDTLAVGAVGESGDARSTLADPNDNQPRAGAVYVYTRGADGAWAPTAYLKAANAGASDGFGGEVALAGAALVVGAAGEDGDGGSTVDAPNEGASRAGAAYVFEQGADGAWTQTAYLKAPAAQPEDAFGLSVALADDMAVVGAIGSAVDDVDTAGAAHVFARREGGWVHRASLSAANAQTFDEFGHGVAIAGEAVFVGARLEAGDAQSTLGDPNDNRPGAGAVYVRQPGQ